MPDIKITINKSTWQIQVEAQGYQGGKCLVDTDELTKILEMQTVSQKLKPELARRQSVQKVGG